MFLLFAETDAVVSVLCVFVVGGEKRNKVRRSGEGGHRRRNRKRNQKEGQKRKEREAQSIPREVARP